MKSLRSATGIPNEINFYNNLEYYNKYTYSK